MSFGLLSSDEARDTDLYISWFPSPGNCEGFGSFPSKSNASRYHLSPLPRLGSLLPLRSSAPKSYGNFHTLPNFPGLFTSLFAMKQPRSSKAVKIRRAVPLASSSPLSTLLEYSRKKARSILPRFAGRGRSEKACRFQLFRGRWRRARWQSTNHHQLILILSSSHLSSTTTSQPNQLYHSE